MQAATARAAEWWTRPRGAQASQWIQNYQHSLTTRHRVLISQIVGELQPTTLLEVGCHCGPNLIRLALDHPTLRCVGMDPSAEAVQAGTQWAAASNLGDRVSLHVGRFPEGTDPLPTGAYDVVLTCYAVGAYVAPGDLHAALYELGRIAKRAVMIAEPMVDGETRSKQTINGYAEWHHDYRRAVKWAPTLHQRAARMIPVEPPVDALNGILVLGA